MSQPPVKVTLRPTSSATSTMSFPDAAQERINERHAPDTPKASPREAYMNYQASLNQQPEQQAPVSQPSPTPPTPQQVVADVFGTVKPRAKDALNLASTLTDAQRDAGMCTVWLPSNGYFYDFAALSVSTRVKGLHQAKFNKANKENNIRYTVEAVTSLLGDGVDAANLTLEDFFFVMYWIRLVAYTKSQYAHKVRCVSQKHTDMIEAGQVEASTRVSSHFITNTDLTESYLDPSKIEELTFPHLEAEGVKIRPTLMSDVIAFSEEITQRFSKVDPDTGGVTFDAEYEEMAYLGDLASYILSYMGEGNLTLGQRMTVAGDLSLEAIEEIRAFAAATSGYGVREVIRVSCPTCQEPIESEVSISAQAFL